MLDKKYAAQGLVVLGFPCNQFGKQEPGGADEIAQTCHIDYGVSFPMFGKVDVNGAGTHPVFRFLKDELPGVLGGSSGTSLNSWSDATESRLSVLPPTRLKRK